MPVPVIQLETDATSPVEEIFTDVESHWAKDDIEFVYNEGIMNGTSESTFEPEATTTRAMLVTILHRMEGAPASTAENPFTDVKTGTWYHDAVIWAAENSIVNGYGNGIFAPNDPITREQIAAIFHRYAVYKGYDTTASADLSRFTDNAMISNFAKTPLAWANAVGLVNGVTTSTLCPRDNATRAQIAAIVRRFYTYF